MSLMIIILVGILIIAKSSAVYDFYIRKSLASGSLLYLPSKDTMHQHTIVSGGGFIFGSFSLFLIGLWSATSPNVVTSTFICCAATILLLGFRDDVSPLSIKVRLAVQTLCSLAISLQLPVPELFADFGQTFWMLFSTFFLTACINLYNFFDGIDGLATAQGLAFCFFAVVLGLMSSNGQEQAIFAALIGMPLISFCKWNWHPAKLFMGDAGSTFLGFSFGVIILWSSSAGEPLNFVNLCAVMMPCFFECSRVILQRIFNKEKFWTTHHKHTFQRLVKTGNSHRKVALLYLCAAVSIGAFIVLLSAGIPYIDSIQRLLVGAIPCILLFTFCLSVESKSTETLRRNILTPFQSGANSLLGSFTNSVTQETEHEHLDYLFSEIVSENKKILAELEDIIDLKPDEIKSEGPVDLDIIALKG